MGTYPTTPSLVLAIGEDLQKHINANKEKLIGKPILNKFGVDLPYLPKVTTPQGLTTRILSSTLDPLNCKSSPTPNPPRQGTRCETA